MSEPLLAVEDLHAYYDQSHVVQGVSLHVNPGEIISSTVINYLIDSLIDIDQRLSALSAVVPSGPVSISAFEPPFQVARFGF